MVREDFEKMKSTDHMVDYNENSSAQQSLVHLLSERIEKLAGQIDHDTPEFRFVDYGCGPGQSTVETAKPAILGYRKRFPDAPVVVCHADQSGNDWNTLFEIATGDSGYNREGNGVRMEAAVGSFYNQVVSDSSVSLGTCIFASHWLSHAVDIEAPGTVWFADARGKAREQLNQLAQEDWTRFLLNRAREMHKGAYLLVGTLGSIPDAQEVNRAAASGRGIYRAIQTVAQGMVDDKLLKAESLDRFLFSLWFLTEDEALAPLKGDPDLRDLFEVDEVSVQAAPSFPKDLFEQSIGDPQTYARNYVGYTRAFADTTLRTQLFGQSATTEGETEVLASEFYRRLDQLYQTETNRYACEVWHLVVQLRKR